VAALVAWLALAASGPARAKSFTVENVNVDAVLHPDGSMQVVENITYDFEGSFTRGTRPIPRGEYAITDVRVTEGEAPLPIEGAPHNLSWRFSAQDEERTFTVSYRAAPTTR
jgi:hypothetical protein